MSIELLQQLRELPILDVLEPLAANLAIQMNAVIQAPPGAGKTTAIPLALLNQPWMTGQRLIMIEPRRLAARAAASRMASLMAEPVGGICGYRVRMDSRVSAATRIEVMTDGVFTRIIQDDPSLEGIGAVIFDEFHERRLETDLGLAFCLEAQESVRPDLRLLAMSATLDAGPVATLMNNASILTASARSFPVDIRYRPPPSDRSGTTQLPTEAIIDVIAGALRIPGGILVFLPGSHEIRQIECALDGRLPPGVDLFPLYGDLDVERQNKALAPSLSGRRKIVLATSIAETSLTIPGICQVVDVGLARSSRYDPRTGMTRLVTMRVSQAAAEQRAGRAGRTEPGICWRLWDRVQHNTLAARTEPEIKTADLVPFALELAKWGVGQANALRLLDMPEPAALSAARRVLLRLEAISPDHRLTKHGQAISVTGLHPRLGHMILRGKQLGEGMLAVAIATVESEAAAGRNSDLRIRLEPLAAPTEQGLDDQGRYLRRVAKNTCRQMAITFQSFAPLHAGRLLALAFPDRIAQRRGAAGRFRLSEGQGAWLSETDPLANEAFLAVADLDGQKPDSRIRLAAPISLREIEEIFEHHINVKDDVFFDAATGSVQTRQRRLFGALVIEDKPLATAPAEATAAALIEGIRRHAGLDALPWTSSAQSLRHRVAFLTRIDGPRSVWPTLSSSALLATLEAWLAPALSNRRSIKDLATLDMDAFMRDLIGWEMMRVLDRRAPIRLSIPTGREVEIDYETEDVPILAVKLQELFGLAATPSVDDGRCPLSIHLLSPAGRPVQITRDLAAFWRGSYKAVRSDLRGRYPRHPWPEDPLTAVATAKTKRASLT